MMRLQNIFLISLLVSVLVSCVTNSVKYTNSEAEILKANHDLEFSDARMPAGETIVGDVTATDRKISQSTDGIAFASATLATLQGTWSSKCTRAYTKDVPAWFLETLKFEASSYTKSIVKFADNACKKSLQQVINSKIKIEMTVSTPSGFRLTNNWDEAKQTLSSPSISAKNCDQETAFPGCSESSFTSQRKAPWLIAALSGSDELLTDKHGPDFANCEKPQLVDGEKWCLLLKKSSQ
jgi:hypothetical protein